MLHRVREACRILGTVGEILLGTPVLVEIEKEGVSRRSKFSVGGGIEKISSTKFFSLFFLLKGDQSTEHALGRSIARIHNPLYTVPYAVNVGARVAPPLAAKVQ